MRGKSPRKKKAKTKEKHLEYKIELTQIRSKRFWSNFDKITFMTQINATNRTVNWNYSSRVNWQIYKHRPSCTIAHKPTPTVTHTQHNYDVTFANRFANSRGGKLCSRLRVITITARSSNPIFTFHFNTGDTLSPHPLTLFAPK